MDLTHEALKMAGALALVVMVLLGGLAWVRRTFGELPGQGDGSTADIDFPIFELVNHRTSVAKHLQQQRLGDRAQDRGVLAEVNSDTPCQPLAYRDTQHDTPHTGQHLGDLV